MITQVKQAAEKGSGLPLGGILPASGELVNQELSGTSYLGLEEDVEVIRLAESIFTEIIV